MNTDLRRSKRYTDFIAVSVQARHHTNDSREAGPFAGRIINISRHGVCLLMPLGVLDTYDVYRATSRNHKLHLDIRGRIPSGPGRFSLSASPVWMDPVVLDDIRAFKMGAAFLSSEDIQRSEEIIDHITAEPDDDLFEPDLTP